MCMHVHVFICVQVDMYAHADVIHVEGRGQPPVDTGVIGSLPIAHLAF